MTTNPYTRLKETSQKFTKKLRDLKCPAVGEYNSNTTNIDYADLKTTIKIGQRLGYDVKLTIDEKTNIVTIYYAEKIPYIPWELQ